MNILGISCHYHDSAASLVRDGRIVAAAQEERFTRLKHDPGFPSHAIRYCLEEASVGPGQLDAVVFYEKPVTKFGRVANTFLDTAPRGLGVFVDAIPDWMRRKLWIAYDVRRELEQLGQTEAELHYCEHHLSHAASAFYPSPFDRAAVLTMDAVGEWATTTIGHGRDHGIELLQEQRFPHSVGLLYSAFTYHCGFRVNSGEYKLMGLAPFGEPRFERTIRDELVDVRPDGSMRLNLDYFDFLSGRTMTNERFSELFGGPPRRPDQQVTHREADLARSIQAVTEDIVLRAARHAHHVTGEPYLCMAGGVALNCVANGRLLREGPFDDLWIQPAAGDAGGAVGAALWLWHAVCGRSREPARPDGMSNAYLGPSFTTGEARAALDDVHAVYEEIPDEDLLVKKVAELVAAGSVVGLFRGRMEFGPRALGNRSIIGDARSPAMQSVLNRKIKFRESFRPFAPVVLEERVESFFELDRPSPYMLLVADVEREHRTATGGGEASIMERVHQIRSTIPAVTHVDHSARVQTVNEQTNPFLTRLLREFDTRTGVPILINTSFNVRGEPIVCTPLDAYACFMRTEMDHLVIENLALSKADQPDGVDDLPPLRTIED